MASVKNDTPYFSNLTPLRGIAALVVVFDHADIMLLNGNLLLKYNVLKFASEFYLMVDFFFILSGFILLHVYKNWFKEKVQKTSFWQFTVARFARIYPLHFFVLIFLAAVYAIALARHLPIGHFAAYSNTWKTFIYSLFLIQSMNVYNYHSWNSPAWSISVEWWMYMLFPFMVRFFLNLRNRGRVIVFLACIGGYLLIMFYLQKLVTYPENSAIFKPAVTPTDINVTYQFGFVRCLCGFTIGMLVYLLYTDSIGKKWFGRTTTFAFLCTCTLICMYIPVWDFIIVIFFAAIILSAAFGSKKINDFFSLPWMQRLGDWSYSIYLVHMPVLYFFVRIVAFISRRVNGENAPVSFSLPVNWLIALSFATVAVIVAAFTYRFIELPCRKWINKRFKGHYTPHVKPVALS